MIVMGIIKTILNDDDNDINNDNISSIHQYQ